MDRIAAAFQTRRGSARRFRVASAGCSRLLLQLDDVSRFPHAFRFAQASALVAVLDTLSLPYILLGDFNDEPGSRTISLFRQRAIEVRKSSLDRLTFSSTEPTKEIDFIFAMPAAAWYVGAARPVTERIYGKTADRISRAQHTVRVWDQPSLTRSAA